MSKARYRKAKVVTDKDGKTSIVLPEQLEYKDQIDLIKWAETQRHKGRPLADYIIHIPNGGKMSPAAGAKLKAMGVKKGYPDMMIDIAKGGYHGMRVELKRKKGGKTSQDQTERLQMLKEEGYYAIVPKGYLEAVTRITEYMAGKQLITDKPGEQHE